MKQASCLSSERRRSLTRSHTRSQGSLHSRVCESADRLALALAAVPRHWALAGTSVTCAKCGSGHLPVFAFPGHSVVFTSRRRSRRRRRPHDLALRPGTKGKVVDTATDTGSAVARTVIHGSISRNSRRPPSPLRHEPRARRPHNNARVPPPMQAGRRNPA